MIVTGIERKLSEIGILDPYMVLRKTRDTRGKYETWASYGSKKLAIRVAGMQFTFTHVDTRTGQAYQHVYSVIVADTRTGEIIWQKENV